MWQDASERNSGTDQGIEFFVTTDSELEVAGRDALDFEILGGVSCELENFGGQVFEHSCNVDGCLSSNAHLVLGVVF